MIPRVKLNTKTTVAIDEVIHKKIKKLALLLDANQGKIVEQAINLLEQQVLDQNLNLKEKSKKIQSDLEKVENILVDARNKVWKSDPQRKKLQLQLEKSPIQIEDVLFTDWISELED